MSLISIFPKAVAASDGITEVIAAPAADQRSQSIHRLQIGVAGLGAMVLLIGLAQAISDRAKLSEAETGPAAAATIAPAGPAVIQNDPLAEAGVVPDLPGDPVATRTQEPAIMPEQGNVQPQQ